jgi:predicted nucleic acid-binding protein
VSERALLDTSVVIEPPDGSAFPEQAAVSVITIAELEKGVLVAPSDTEQGKRLAHLGEVEARFSALSFDVASARVLGRYMAEAKREERRLRVRDAIIAATGEAHDLIVYTRDDDFERFGARVVIVGPGD